MKNRYQQTRETIENTWDSPPRIVAQGNSHNQFVPEGEKKDDEMILQKTHSDEKNIIEFN